MYFATPGMSSSSRLRSARSLPAGWVLTFVSFGACRLLVLRAVGKADRDMGRVRNVDAAASIDLPERSAHDGSCLYVLSRPRKRDQRPRRPQASRLGPR